MNGGPEFTRLAIEQRSNFAPLRNPDYRMLWTAIMVSNLGGLIQTVGAGWLMTSLTASQDMIALVQSSNTLPIMALSMIGGVLADNFDRRRIMILAQCFLAVISFALALTALAGMLTPWLLGFTFLLKSPASRSTTRPGRHRSETLSAAAICPPQLALTAWVST